MSIPLINDPSTQAWLALTFMGSMALSAWTGKQGIILGPLLAFIGPTALVTYEFANDWLNYRVDANEMADPLMLFLGLILAVLSLFSGLLGALLGFWISAAVKPRTSKLTR
jgi:hypothetical protein